MSASCVEFITHIRSDLQPTSALNKTHKHRLVQFNNKPLFTHIHLLLT